jgi:hypothetical protein
MNRYIIMKIIIILDGKVKKKNKALCNKKGWEEGRRTIVVIVMSANML